MNENELKARLQHDAELFANAFDEELCERIRNEIAVQPLPSCASRPHHFVFQYAVLICSSILIGIGIWSLTRSHSQTDPNAVVRTNVSVYPSDSGMNITPSQVALSPGSASAPAPSHPSAPSVFDVPNGTLFDLSDPQSEHLGKFIQVLIPGRELVHLGRRMEFQPENGDAPEETPSSFLDEAAEAVRVQVEWILDE